jgi:Fe-S-cluster-containing dehydrogenase component
MKQIYLDANRCIGCRACVEACSECPGHGGFSMIHLDHVARAASVQTSPTVCMHCVEPACAAVCPADAIKIDADGVVHSALVERCIGCGNCALACPFGVPKIDAEHELMRKCDLCHDRTSLDLAPMCATVCPSGALFYGTRDEVEDRRRARPLAEFVFDGHAVITRNAFMVPVSVGHIEVAPGAGPARSRAERDLAEVPCP